MEKQYMFDPSNPQSSNPPPPHVYGTFSASAAPFPTPMPPPQFQPQPQPYHVIPVSVGYQTYVYPPVTEGIPVIRRLREPQLPCCGLGIGWALFVAGFFFAVPWYVGTFILLFVAIDHREKAGLVACTVAAVLAAMAAILGASGTQNLW